MMFGEFLTIDELEASTRAAARDARVAITPLGFSRLGRPIEMISIGEGAHDALIVGVPHANEPLGAVTVERMISLLLASERERRDYRWHFIKAIDPEGLKLNGHWLKTRTVASYLENFFRPALYRQPETTFPLDIPGARFDASTPENEAWQRAFALTRPSLHASLHHCDFGGGFFSLSRALPGALAGLEQALQESRLGIDTLEDDVMVMERWTAAIHRYPSVPELTASAKAAGAAWAYPWTVGEMSPGFGEARYGTFTLIAEVPQWDSASLHDASSSGVSRGEHEARLRKLSSSARDIVVRHIADFPEADLGPDAKECLWALQEGLKMLPASGPETSPDAVSGQCMLSRRDFDLAHTRQALYVLRSYGLLHRLASLVLGNEADNVAALRAQAVTAAAIRLELAVLAEHTTFTPIPIEVLTSMQMRAIFVCAEALAGSFEPARSP